MIELRKAYVTLHMQICVAMLDSREKSLALTELENSAMWAMKALSHNDNE